MDNLRDTGWKMEGNIEGMVKKLRCGKWQISSGNNKFCVSQN